MPRSDTGIYGYALQSELPLTRLRPCREPRGSLLIARAVAELLEEPAELIQLLEYPDDGGIAFAVARGDNALLVWCSLTGGYRIDATRGQIWSQPEGSPEEWEDRLLNAMIPLALIARGELMLHAAAVLTDAGAVVVCGYSGRGKSTLAAALGAHGLPVLAEDAVALTPTADGALLWPGPTGVRLDTATASSLGVPASAGSLVRGKHMHRPEAPEPTCEPIGVAAIVRLEERGGSVLSATSVAGAEAMASVFPHVYRLEPDRWSEVFGRTAEVVRRVPCYSARLPDELCALPEAALELIDSVTEGVSRLRAA